MSEKPWREEWDEQADDWVALTHEDPFHDLLNEPALLELLPPPGRRPTSSSAARASGLNLR